MQEIRNEDCMIAMQEIRNGEYDLAIIDPPYGINAANYTRGGKQYGKSVTQSTNYGRKNWDKQAPNKKYFDELFRVSKNQIIFGANHFISCIPYDSSCWIVWDKQNGENEYADCELAWTSFNTAVRVFRFRWQGMLQGNMKNKEIRIHPTQKPVALYEWILQNYAKPGYKILDTHVGSGSSLIACYNMGFDCMGYEIDKDYFTAAQNRLKEAQAQIRLEYYLEQPTFQQEELF